MDEFRLRADQSCPDARGAKGFRPAVQHRVGYEERASRGIGVMRIRLVDNFSGHLREDNTRFLILSL